MKMRKIVAILLTAALTLSLVACAATPAPAAAPAEPAAAAEEAAEEKEEAAAPAGTVDPKSITIACSVYQQDAHQSLIRQGVIDAAAEYGVNCLTTVTDSDVAKELEFLTTCTSQGVQGYVWAPCGTAAVGPLSEAKDAGAYVSIVNGLPSGTDLPVDPVAYFDGNFYNNSQSMCDTLGEVVKPNLEEVFADNIESGEPLKIGIIAFDALSKEVSDDRANAILDKLDELGIKYDIVSRQDAVEQDKAIEVSQGMLTAEPNLDLFVSCCESASIGAITTVVNEKKQGQCYVAGIDTSVQIAKLMVENPDVGLAFVGQSSYDGGYQAAVQIIKLCLGIDPEETAAKQGKENSLDDMILDRANPDGIQEYIDFMASLGVTG